MKAMKYIARTILTLTVMAASLAVTVAVLMSMLMISGTYGRSNESSAVDLGTMDRFDMYVTNQVSSALDGVLAIEKVYWLRDTDLIAPEPDQSKFGKATDPAELAGVLADAEKLLNGQTTLFQTDTPVAKGKEINYYLDETILVITWKQPFNGAMYTISEVKIAHPSQFRRFLSGGQYGSGIQQLTTHMAQNVNAVVASSGDFYAFRREGVIVNGGTIYRSDTKLVDTCYIDENGDMHFTYRGELPTMESAQAYVDEHDVRFSIAFGPVLIDDGQPNTFSSYPLGEVGDNYTRGALCQMDELHYLLVVAGQDPPYITAPKLKVFQDVLMSFGCEKAYTLDGGQTATIVMNDVMINRVLYGYKERYISDIIYFATAIPD